MSRQCRECAWCVSQRAKCARSRSDNCLTEEKVKGTSRDAKSQMRDSHVAVLMFLLFRDVACKNKIKLADLRDIFEKTTAHARLVDFLDQSLGGSNN